MHYYYLLICLIVLHTNFEFCQCMFETIGIVPEGILIGLEFSFEHTLLVVFFSRRAC